MYSMYLIKGPCICIPTWTTNCPKTLFSFFLVKSDDLDEPVDLPDAVAVGADLPELEAHLALGLGAVWAHARGVVVTA